MKLQHVFYVEKLALKSDRIAPTLRDVTKVRSVKGLKDLLGALSDLLEGAKGLLDAPKNLRGNPKELRGLGDLFGALSDLLKGVKRSRSYEKPPRKSEGVVRSQGPTQRSE